MHKMNKPAKNLVALRYTLKEYEDSIREELKSAIAKAGLSEAQTQQMMQLMESTLQNLKSRHFAVEGRVELYQYPLMSMTASGKFKRPYPGDDCLCGTDPSAPGVSTAVGDSEGSPDG